MIRLGQGLHLRDLKRRDSRFFLSLLFFFLRFQSISNQARKNFEQFWYSRTFNNRRCWKSSLKVHPRLQNIKTFQLDLPFGPLRFFENCFRINKRLKIFQRPLLDLFNLRQKIWVSEKLGNLLFLGLLIKNWHLRQQSRDRTAAPLPIPDTVNRLNLTVDKN